MNYLCIDAGTTCTKAQVFDDKGEILFYESRNCPLKQIDGESYADVEKIVATVKELIALAARGAKIDAIAVSTFGESFVTLDASGEILTYPMLYTDGRGEKEAEKLKNEFGNEYFFKKFPSLHPYRSGLPPQAQALCHTPFRFAGCKTGLSPAPMHHFFASRRPPGYSPRSGAS